MHKITNYEKLRTDLDLIANWAPDVVIVDEAQRVKNWNTIAARALKRIDSPYAIVLTGTPLENKLEELISIVQFVDQHRLGPTWKLLHEPSKKACCRCWPSNVRCLPVFWTEGLARFRWAAHA